MKDVQGRGETSSTSKHEVSKRIPIIVGQFCPPGFLFPVRTGSSRPKSMRTSDADPGSGAFLTPGYGIRIRMWDEQPDDIS